MFEGGDEVASFNEKDFQKLKNHFEKEINSNRRFEQITTVQELVSVLEDRNALTDEILLEQEPNFASFVRNRRRNHADSKKSFIPERVVNRISEDFQCSWKPLGDQLKLKKDQLERCRTPQDVLSYYVKNCEGVSEQEMIFRLNRALEKCGKLNFKMPGVELLKKKQA